MVKKKKEIKVSKDVVERKQKEINEILELIDASNSVIVASIKSLPTKQLQIIKKDLRGKAEVRVLKKNIISRVLDAVKQPGLKNLKSYVKEDTAFLFSKLDPFELSGILSESKNPVKAKIGQTAESNIEIEPGLTDLIPGPVISELSALGIKISIEDGKINIREKKTIVKAGEKISEVAAGLMSKLDIKPFYVGLEPLVGYDKSNDKVYENIRIDRSKALEELRNFVASALRFAVSVSYYCKDTIKYLLREALSHEKALEKFIKTEQPAHTQPTETQKESIKSQQLPQETQINIQGGQ